MAVLASKAANNFESKDTNKSNCWAEAICFVHNMSKIQAGEKDLSSIRGDIKGCLTVDLPEIMHDQFGPTHRTTSRNPNFDGLSDGHYWVDGRQRSESDTKQIVDDVTRLIMGETNGLSENDTRYGCVTFNWMGQPNGHVTNYIIENGKMSFIEAQHDGAIYDPVKYLRNCRDIRFYTPETNTIKDGMHLEQDKVNVVDSYAEDLLDDYNRRY